jgi:hypothetical protein
MLPSVIELTVECVTYVVSSVETEYVDYTLK